MAGKVMHILLIEGTGASQTHKHHFNSDGSVGKAKLCTVAVRQWENFKRISLHMRPYTHTIHDTLIS